MRGKSLSGKYMTIPPLASSSEGPQPWEARDEAQLILGQIHGVLWIAVKEVDQWLERSGTEDRLLELTADDIRAGGAEVHRHFGTIHASLNTGVHDEDLAGVGLSGAQAQVKRKGFRGAIARLWTGPNRGINLPRLRRCLRWSGTLM